MFAPLPAVALLLPPSRMTYPDVPLRFFPAIFTFSSTALKLHLLPSLLLRCLPHTQFAFATQVVGASPSIPALQMEMGRLRCSLQEHIHGYIIPYNYNSCTYCNKELQYCIFYVFFLTSRCRMRTKITCGALLCFWYGTQTWHWLPLRWTTEWNSSSTTHTDWRQS